MYKASKKGVTLFDMMFTTALTALVLTPMVFFLANCHQMIRYIYTESELALQMRAVRNRLLFRTSPNRDVGLLSGISSADSAAITVRGYNNNPFEGNNPSPMIRLLQRSENRKHFLFNELQPHSRESFNWSTPMGASMPPGVSWDKLVNWQFKNNWESTIYKSPPDASNECYVPPYICIPLTVNAETRYQWIRLPFHKD